MSSFYTPIQNERFFYITPTGEIMQDTFKTKEPSHWDLLLFGNFYITKKQALEAIKEIRKIHWSKPPFLLEQADYHRISFLNYIGFSLNELLFMIKFRDDHIGVENKKRVLSTDMSLHRKDCEACQHLKKIYG